MEDNIYIIKLSNHWMSAVYVEGTDLDEAILASRNTWEVTQSWPVSFWSNKYLGPKVRILTVESTRLNNQLSNQILKLQFLLSF